MKKTLITAVVLNWNNWKTTSNCINSLLKSGHNDLSIIVVDNASEDDSIKQLKKIYPDIKYLINSENTGFACGSNVGIKNAIDSGATHILLINNDVIVNVEFLTDAVRCLECDENIYAVTGKILMGSPPRYIWQAGGYIDMFRIQGVSRGYGELDVNQYDQECYTEWASGAFSLFPIRTFEKFGFLPEEYFFGQEEWDYSKKIINGGKFIKYLPTFSCIHNAGNSYKKNHPILLVYGCYLNKNIFARRYLGKWRYLIWRTLFILYIKIIWPFKAKYYADSYFSVNDYKRAAWAAVADFDRVSKVTRDTLIEASKLLGIQSSWKS